MGLLGQRDPRWIVIYPDGRKSERMDKHVAFNYATIFGGKIECVEPTKFMLFKEKWLTREVWKLRREVLSLNIQIIRKSLAIKSIKLGRWLSDKFDYEDDE